MVNVKKSDANSQYIGNLILIVLISKTPNKNNANSQLEI